MFKRKNKIEVVPPHEYTDFSHRDPKDAYATRKDVAIAAITPIALGAPFIAHRLMNTPETYSATTIPVNAQIPASSPLIEPTSPIIEPMNVLAQTPAVSPDMMIPTGYVADKSLETLANILDPIIEILMVVSFPIASVIMIGGSFFFLLGNSEKAWSTIFNAALGYIIIQMSPLFLQIMREVGEAI